MDKELLIKHIQEKVKISEQEMESIIQQFDIVVIKKKTNLIVEEKLNDRIYFVEKGLLYAYKTLDDGSTQVIQFAKENNWISDLYSFFSSTKSLFTVQTIEDCQLLSITKKQFDSICEIYPKMEKFFRLVFQTAYVNTLKRISDNYSDDAETKYNQCISQHPEIIQRVPQYLIASYLGILPSSLSRIRNKKVKK
ncbi:MAG: Crp/Fnr family transcriptional regulator [Ferruginibacter sp.]